MEQVAPACCAISAGLGGGQSQFLNRYDGAAVSLSFLRLREKGMMFKQALFYNKVYVESLLRDIQYMAALSTSNMDSEAILVFLWSNSSLFI